MQYFNSSMCRIPEDYLFGFNNYLSPKNAIIKNFNYEYCSSIHFLYYLNYQCFFFIENLR
jgi:hypothetical protein